MVIENFNNRNQYLISTNESVIFQSYNAIMFRYDIINKTIYFNTNEDNYTQTTCKYLTRALEWLSETIEHKSTWLTACLKSQNKKRFILSSNIERGIDLND